VLPSLLFAVVFLSQIVLISIHYPRRLKAAAQNLGSDDYSGGTEQSGASALEVYARASHVIGAIGLVVLAALLYLETTDHMEVILLSIGLFFFLQLSPLALPSVRKSWSRLGSAWAQPDTDGADTYRSTRLFDVVGALPVRIAAVLFVSYVVFAGSLWGGEPDTHLLKIAVFTTTQILFVASIAWGVSSLRRAASAAAAEHYQSLKRLAPLLVHASIMISVYYFGKELLAALDEPQLRPAMMSAFLQLLAVLAFSAVRVGREPAATGWLPPERRRRG